MSKKWGPPQWTQTELDGLAKRFPGDYRIPLYRGLYLSKLAFYGETLNSSAIQEFQKALAINPKSALAHYFIGSVYTRAAFWSKAAIQSDEAKDAARRRAANEYTMAISLDSRLKEAYANRADSYLGVKQYLAAIRDFDKVVELDPKDAGAYHDRALAKDNLGNTLAAIFDFDEAIRLDTLSDVGLPNAYENRGDAHAKTGMYKEAVADFTAVIRLRLESGSFLMTLKQFRDLYPEYASLSDAGLLSKIHDQFWPQYEREKFDKVILDNKEFKTFLLPDVYMKRSDAYLRSYQFRKAHADFNRAIAGSDNGGRFLERWRTLGKSSTGEHLVDLKTLEFAPIARIWLKTTKPKGAYDVESMEVDCKGRKLTESSLTTYDADGKVVKSSSASGGWQIIIPDTLGEELYDGMCRSD